ncbi:hypothetical protein CO173_03065 [Candidatus Uhrbacteria bacterium CG_4_9_14_3_um_filter_41_35]|uniref:Uncharacterized protein n=1 Tax=Candidatus Uhrbacteria bacterium CG_4_9_14_3_um_filter_41_35 TaxID=1975034 RepID=A0A2M7XEL5_9BACT|nr:MAG: hypothetical protein COV92_00660 [Candidatus Uhrbacteria bacterium CG11_big_fil_rev_8_21_14_0_20_41_9]PJA46314.1 MAG: hypothetical protein CO173_03065 [Candidatus Uhrbacteria bacterium CG_4_9_14_3_um_filter_41_35]
MALIASEYQILLAASGNSDTAVGLRGRIWSQLRAMLEAGSISSKLYDELKEPLWFCDVHLLVEQMYFKGLLMPREDGIFSITEHGRRVLYEIEHKETSLQLVAS